MISTEQRRRLLGTPYVESGREPGVGIDCLGVVLYLCTLKGLPAPDPWPQIQAAWRRGDLSTASGFPPGWSRVTDGAITEGDVLLFFGRHPWSAIVFDGYVWSAHPEVGTPYCRPLIRWLKKPAETWRYAEDSREARPPG